MAAPTNPSARIVDVGKRKPSLALEVTLPDGETLVSKGNRATAAGVVAIWRRTADADDVAPAGQFVFGFTAHKRADLVAQTYAQPHYQHLSVVAVLDVAR